MDMALIRGLITAALFVLFCALVVWSYSKGRKQDFDEAAAMPLEDDQDMGRHS